METQNSNNNHFVSKDLYLSALCYAKGLKLERVERQGQTCWFVFENNEEGERLQQGFFTKTVEVNAREYVNAIRALKDLVFAE